MPLELYGTKTCPYTAELREDLEFHGRDFAEYDVEDDRDALRRMSALCGGGAAAVPVLVEDGRVLQVGLRRALVLRRRPGRRGEVKAQAGALDLRIRGVVQGVGFRPFVYRLAHRHALAGWVLNGESGVQVHVEGPRDALEAFARAVVAEAPPAASIASVDTVEARHEGFDAFAIRESGSGEALSARISPDLPVCEACLRELFDPADRRYRYPYITCTDCGPRYSIILALPYDRPRTTMAAWPMCAACDAEYHDPHEPPLPRAAARMSVPAARRICCGATAAAQMRRAEPMRSKRPRRCCARARSSR